MIGDMGKEMMLLRDEDNGSGVGGTGGSGRRGDGRRNSDQKNTNNNKDTDADNISTRYIKALKASFMETIIARHNEACQPLRLCVVLPRLADVGDLRRAICQASLYPTNTSSDTNPSPSPWTACLGPPLPQRLTLLDCYPPGGLIRSVLDDRESVLQVMM